MVVLGALLKIVALKSSFPTRKKQFAKKRIGNSRVFVSRDRQVIAYWEYWRQFFGTELRMLPLDLAKNLAKRFIRICKVFFSGVCSESGLDLLKKDGW